MRQSLYLAVDSVLRGFSDELYAAYSLESAEHVETYEASLDEVVADLRAGGYESSSILAALKYHPETGDGDDGALRRVDPDRPTAQWHVHLWEREDGVEVYSHYEYRPDLLPVADESVGETIDRLREHYSPSWGFEWGEGTTYVLGTACEVVSDVVDVEATPYRA